MIGHHPSHRPMTMASTFLFGFAAGGAIALLLAPRSGAETRGLLKGEIAKGKQHIDDAAADLKMKANSMVEAGKERVHQEAERIAGGVHRIGDAIDAGRQAYRSTLAGEGAANGGLRS